MGFAKTIETWPVSRVEEMISHVRPADVLHALGREHRDEGDLAALLSPSATPHLEAMAREAQRLTRLHFGRTVGLYAPVYLSNVCWADCAYCMYAVHSGSKEERLTLTTETIRRECESLSALGFQNVLLLTGEAPGIATADYIADAVTVAGEYFASVSVEVYALTAEDYGQLVDAGLEGVTLYQETYDRATYELVHRSGTKTDYEYRLDALERAGRAGVRRLNAGVLLGLADWRADAFRLGLHARHLQRACWQSAIGVSFPRLRNVPSGFAIPHMVTDPEMVQIILALRLFLPEASFSLSTRERPVFRDRLVHLGITAMSAGSSTRPGGYTECGDDVLEQFAVEDKRSPDEVVAAIRRAGYDPVWKDFDRAFTLDAAKPA